MPGEGAHAAVKVTDWRGKEDATDGAQNWVAEISVKRRYGSGRDSSAKTVAHHKTRTFAKLVQKARRMAEIVAAVGVKNQHVRGGRSLDASR